MRVYVAGHRGMVGRAIVAELDRRGYTPVSGNIDLCDQSAVRRFFERNAVDYVVLAAARVGGIHANATYPAEFIYQNLMIESNVIHEAWRSGVERLLFLGSSCIYPRLSPQPIKESALLTGPLEPTNEPYAVAKIAGIKLCESYNRQYGTRYRCVMPTNLYGPHDKFSLDGHVIPALLSRFHSAKIAGSNVEVWGSGEARREFLYVEDLAEACVYLMDLDPPDLINIGTGMDVTIRQLAGLIKSVVGFDGEIVFDSTKPDGTPRKLLDVSRMERLGWRAKTDLETGLERTYRWLLDHQSNVRRP